MNSVELWNNLSECNNIVSKSNDYYIFPKNTIKIKNKGVISFLKKDGATNKIKIFCRNTKKLFATEDHPLTLTDGTETTAANIKLGEKILSGLNGKSVSTLSRSFKKECKNKYSYDVTTSSSHFMVNELYSHNCRSSLSPIWETVEYPEDHVFDWQYITDRNVQYDGAFSKNVNYDMPLTHSSLSDIKSEDLSKIAINFAGNTGWPVRLNPDKKTITVREPKVYGRWNNGVITMNLPHVALEAVEATRKAHTTETESEDQVDAYQYPDEIMSTFFKLLEERMELCHKALKIRNEACRRIKAKNSPILWQYGAYFRNHDKPDMTIGEIMDRYPTRCSISLGYVGLFETCEALIKQSNTSTDGRALSKKILLYINDVLKAWKEQEHLGYSLYGTPEESLTYKFALALQKRFGYIEKITDKDYIVNSYHIDPREQIDAFSKLKIEGEYLALSSGGAVSYIETADLSNNPESIETVIQYMHENIMYAEVNRKIGICYKCGYQGDIPLTKTISGNFVFTCPHCGNTDDNTMNITARLCGYIGKVNAGETNRGRMDDIFHRVIHLE